MAEPSTNPPVFPGLPFRSSHLGAAHGPPAPDFLPPHTATHPPLSSFLRERGGRGQSGSRAWGGDNDAISNFSMTRFKFPFSHCVFMYTSSTSTVHVPAASVQEQAANSLIARGGATHPDVRQGECAFFSLLIRAGQPYCESDSSNRFLACLAVAQEILSAEIREISIFWIK